MAKQKGAIVLSGTIGNVTFYNGKNGAWAQNKTSLNREMIYTRPTMDITRKNMTEFGYSSRCGKLIRNAVKSCISLPNDKQRAPNMVKLIRKIMVTDSESNLGERKIDKGNLSILKGFEFNKNAHLFSICSAEPHIHINRKDSKAIINIPSFNPLDSLKSPNGATHYSMETICCEIDFNTEVINATIISTGKLLLSDNPSTPINNIHFLNDKSLASIFIVIAIQFFELINEKYDKMENKAFIPVTIVEVNNLL